MAMIAKKYSAKKYGFRQFSYNLLEPGWFSHVVETRIPKKLLLPPEKNSIKNGMRIKSSQGFARIMYVYLISGEFDPI